MSKVCIIGTHCVGKTTLLNDVRRELQSKNVYVPFIEERARQMLELHGLEWPSLDPGSYDSLQWHLYYYYDFSLFLYDKFISDRHHIDCIAYSIYRKLPGAKKMFKMLKERSADMTDFDIYFYRMDPIEEDKNTVGGLCDTRDTPLSLEREIEGTIKAILDEAQIDFSEFSRLNYTEIKEEIVNKFLA